MSMSGQSSVAMVAARRSSSRVEACLEKTNKAKSTLAKTPAGIRPKKRSWAMEGEKKRAFTSSVVADDPPTDTAPRPRARCPRRSRRRLCRGPGCRASRRRRRDVKMRPLLVVMMIQGEKAHTLCGGGVNMFDARETYRLKHGRAGGERCVFPARPIGKLPSWIAYQQVP